MEEQKTPGMRIRALREMKFQSIRNLAEQAGISPSTLGRIETGAMKSIGSETLAKLAVALDVSADYILGLTPVQKRRNMDIVATGLSEESVRRLIHRTVDTDIVNRLMEHKSFPLLTKYIRMYFSNQAQYGMQARNSLFDLATDELRNIALSPEQKREAMESAVLLKSQKTAPHEAEMEKIKTTFLAILKDIKKGLESEQPTSPPHTDAGIPGDSANGGQRRRRSPGPGRVPGQAHRRHAPDLPHVRRERPAVQGAFPIHDRGQGRRTTHADITRGVFREEAVPPFRGRHFQVRTDIPLPAASMEEQKEPAARSWHARWLLLTSRRPPRRSVPLQCQWPAKV